MAKKKLVLITGAAGTYGRILRTEWSDRYDVRPMPPCSTSPRDPHGRTERPRRRLGTPSRGDRAQNIPADASFS
jgi:hypothetical protein